MSCKTFLILSVTVGTFLLSAIACTDTGKNGADRPRLVKIEKIDSRYTLTVDGNPFYVKGAGCEFGNIEALAAHGANSFRTWRTDNGKHSGQEVLDKGLENGLMVCMGLEIARERHGFDYNDAEAVKSQFEYVKGEVLKYKDHPALLAWGIGNELNLRTTNPAVWDVVNDIAGMIHEVDPNHPATTMLAGFSKGLWDEMKIRCPNLDFLSFQSYADIINLPAYIKEAGYDGPYLVTEWGATGHWESPLTEWGRPIEQNSKNKAESYLYRYKNVIEADRNNCLGSYVFLWGQKQERTPTWYGMFLENGDETASIDVMHFIWNGEWPANQTPRLDSLVMNGRTAYSSISTDPGEACTASVFVEDPDGDELSTIWEIIPEVPQNKQSDGGDFEKRPASISTGFKIVSDGSVEFNCPDSHGEYRLFVYVSDGNGHSATANIPFLVKN